MGSTNFDPLKSFRDDLALLFRIAHAEELARFVKIGLIAFHDNVVCVNQLATLLHSGVVALKTNLRLKDEVAHDTALLDFEFLSASLNFIRDGSGDLIESNPMLTLSRRGDRVTADKHASGPVCCWQLNVGRDASRMSQRHFKRGLVFSVDRNRSVRRCNVAASVPQTTGQGRIIAVVQPGVAGWTPRTKRGNRFAGAAPQAWFQSWLGFSWYGVFLPRPLHNTPDRLLNKYQDLAPNESTARYWANVQWLGEVSGMRARIVIEGWDKSIARPGRNELYKLKTDPDDRNDLSSTNSEKLVELMGLIDKWIEPTTQPAACILDEQ